MTNHPNRSKRFYEVWRIDAVRPALARQMGSFRTPTRAEKYIGELERLEPGAKFEIRTRQRTPAQ